MTESQGLQKKPASIRFQKHVNILVWKSYMMRQRSWRLLLLETSFAAMCFLIAVFVAKPVFLTPLQAEPEPPLSSSDILASLKKDTIVGYTPDTEPYVTIMNRAAELLSSRMLAASQLQDLNDILYNHSRGSKILNKVIWILWEKKERNIFNVSIRSSELARYATQVATVSDANRHLRAGFMAVQLAISQAVLEFASPEAPTYELSLVSMPVSPLMEEVKVRRAISLILMCFTIALLSPVLETEAIVVTETHSRFKRALRILNVDYSTMYIGWLLYAVVTALPICLLGAIALILIFRWIHLLFALLTLLSYTCVMIMLAMIMAMFHSKAWIACVWSTLFTLLQTFLAELMMHHGYDDQHGFQKFLIHMLVPPLGLVDGFNHFALLQTSRNTSAYGSTYTILLWCVMIFLYFQLLMLLQRTIGQERAIGGQVSWKSIIFKRAEDKNKLKAIDTLTGKERENLQEVDDLTAKAISFRDVSKNIMNVSVLNNITFDIYRGEFTMLFAERIQERMMNTIEDLLTGLTFPDSGTINVLGSDLRPGYNYMTEQHMMGYCNRSDFLVDSLTVEEHFTLFTELCLWNEKSAFAYEYGQIRIKRLLRECDLESVRLAYVRDLHIYYKAQLCWAIAILLEPRIIILPNFTDEPGYMAVIKDKIMQYKSYLTVVMISFSSLHLESPDRVFLFDNKLLAFGGTPAYMFFKFGREYRLRLNFRSGGSVDDETTEDLLEKAKELGAAVRAHLGALLLLKMPITPTASVAALVKDLYDNSTQYGISSMNITLPDSEEVFRRAIYASRAPTMTESTETVKRALKRIAKQRGWQKKKRMCNYLQLLRITGWKYFSFYIHYRFFFIVTIISALVTGVFIGLSLSDLLMKLDRDHQATLILHGEVLTVEALRQETQLVLRVDNSTTARSVATNYVLSQTYAHLKDVEHMTYIALPNTESLTEYLVTCAIDSPQDYVYKYAYGIDLSNNSEGVLLVQVLYSPLHNDHSAAVRSLARAYMALLRHYTKDKEASLVITNNPLILDQAPWMKSASTPPLLIQFLLVLTISHITLIPSKEYGLIRHLQCHTLNFSPARYWITMYFWDLILYWMLVILMSCTIIGILYLAAPYQYLHYKELLALPFMLIVYGVGCVPQAYLFSLGPRPTLNSMALVIVNIVFGEATIVAKLFYGNAYHYALEFIALSPQFNMAYAFVKIRQNFLYNSECTIFQIKKLCSSKTLHKCCAKCGVLEECFARRSYLESIRNEIFWTLGDAMLFTTLLLLWEYKVIQRIWNMSTQTTQHHEFEVETEGAMREKFEVLDKERQIKMKKSFKNLQLNTFGEYLLASDVSKKHRGMYTLRNVYLGVAKGEALALSGLKRHGRLVLCEIMAGYKLNTEGRVWGMSRWRLKSNPHKYCSNITLCCDREPLPPWMTVYDALEFIATLRGVPKKHRAEEVTDYIEALELSKQSDLSICRLMPYDKKRFHFVAAIVGAPPIIVLDELTAYQKYSIRRSMYYILYHLRKRGHAVLISSASVESHMPVTNQLAIIRDGKIFDIDQVENLLARYSNKGYTVAVHLKDEADVNAMFSKYFDSFVLNDTTEVLVNVQVLDSDLTWANIFEKMEKLQAEHQQLVYSYIVCAVPIDYIYNSILSGEHGLKSADYVSSCFKRCRKHTKICPTKETLAGLMKYDKKYDITKLKELPWSVIFNR